MRVAGLILAGGQGRRMGGVDKAALRLGGQTLLARAIARLGAQTEFLAISAGTDPDRFADYGLPALRDSFPGAGPLGGLLAGLDWAQDLGVDAVATTAVDTPFFPADCIARLARVGPPAIAATDDGAGTLRLEGGFGLWAVTERRALREALGAGIRRVGGWAEVAGARLVPFPDPDAFFNVNRPEDLLRAERVLAEMQ
jgi:molybdopterin-guanine dinucleotide biosynthesis protein A